MDRTLRYHVNDKPPVPILVSAALQLVFIGVAAILPISSVIAGLVCIPMDDPLRARLYCTSLFIVGMATVLNSMFGIRLPIFQGASGTFLPPLLAMRSAGIWSCSPIHTGKSGNVSSSTDENATISMDYNRIAELQGSLMAASVFEVIIGATGLVGFLLRFISPITISVTITLTALSLYRIPVDFCRSNWLISAIGILVLVTLSLYLNRINVPVPKLRKRAGVAKRNGYPVFQFFSILFAIVTVWAVCAVFTFTGLLPDNPESVAYRARTDIKLNILKQTPWLIFPYPGQFGTPSFNSAIFLGFSVAIFSSILESVGDYFANSRVCQAGQPPKHAINRGILIEGIISVLCGAMGTGHATTSYGAVVGVIGMTKIASRLVFATAGILCMVMAVIGKFGAVLALAPDPVIGSVIFVLLGQLTAVGISGLKEVDMSSMRNLSVLGISLYVGIVIPNWIRLYPDELKTGNMQADQVLNVVLGTPMILGIVTSLILDNTVKASQPKKPESLTEGDTECQRINMDRETTDVLEENLKETVSNKAIYDLPGIAKLRKNLKFINYMPFIQPPNCISEKKCERVDENEV